MDENVNINKGDVVEFCLIKNSLETIKRFTLNIKDWLRMLKLRKLLIDDVANLEILETDNLHNVKARVVQGGALLSKKGINLPNQNFFASPNN